MNLLNFKTLFAITMLLCCLRHCSCENLFYCAQLLEDENIVNCCDMPPKSTVQLESDCKALIQNHTGDLNPCLYECAFNLWEIVEHSVLNMRNLHNMLMTIYNNSQFVKTIRPAYQRCYKIAERFSEVDDRSEFRFNTTCSPLPLFYTKCAEITMFSTCPLELYEVTTKCMEYRELFANCRKTLRNLRKRSFHITASGVNNNYVGFYWKLFVGIQSCWIALYLKN